MKLLDSLSLDTGRRGDGRRKDIRQMQKIKAQMERAGLQKRKKKTDKHAGTIPKGLLHNISLEMVGHSDQFISPLSPLASIISRTLTTAIMKLSFTKRWQLLHLVCYLKVRQSPTS